jgi:hypothetical protein
MNTLINFENTERALMEYRDAVVNLYRSNLLREDHVATHRLMDNIQYVFTQGNDSIEVSLMLKDYWKYVEYDTRPHFPPIGNGDPDTGILNWVRVKRLVDKARPYNGKLPTEKQLAYLIARKISREGTKGTHDLQEALDQVDRQFEGKIGEAIGKDLNNVLVSILSRLQTE